MERQDLVEQVLRLYVFVLDEVVNNQQCFIEAIEATTKCKHAGRVQSYKRIQAFIEDHFRPLV